ncbi:hypothetical protein BY458DRAFT_588171 [Sporodiniella umbellata]|nr:hypothetical protein BY458DRAFT_588171 [Sporodiniella umbellata]
MDYSIAISDQPPCSDPRRPNIMNILFSCHYRTGMEELESKSTPEDNHRSEDGSDGSFSLVVTNNNDTSGLFSDPIPARVDSSHDLVSGTHEADSPKSVNDFLESDGETEDTVPFSPAMATQDSNGEAPAFLDLSEPGLFSEGTLPFSESGLSPSPIASQNSTIPFSPLLGPTHSLSPLLDQDTLPFSPTSSADTIPFSPVDSTPLFSPTSSADTIPFSPRDSADTVPSVDTIPVAQDTRAPGISFHFLGSPQPVSQDEEILGLDEEEWSIPFTASDTSDLLGPLERELSYQSDSDSGLDLLGEKRKKTGSQTRLDDYFIEKRKRHIEIGQPSFQPTFDPNKKRVSFI